MSIANRETWLNAVAAKMAPRFAELGYPLPPFRVSIGFTSGGMRANVNGECWNKSTSADERFEIFIVPSEAASMDVAAILAHELTHAAVGFGCGHKGAFADVALALGLQRPLTATTAGPAFIEYAQPFIDELGAIPHAALSYHVPSGKPGGIERGPAGVIQRPPANDNGAGESTRPPKQTTRLLKACCAECGYTVRVTQKWLEVGPPHCPVHGAMVVADHADAA